MSVCHVGKDQPHTNDINLSTYKTWFFITNVLNNIPLRRTPAFVKKFYSGNIMKAKDYSGTYQH